MDFLGHDVICFFTFVKKFSNLSPIVSHHLVCRRGWHLIIASLLIKFFTLSAMVTVISNLIYYQRKHFCYCYCYCYCYCKSKHPCLNMINNFNFSPMIFGGNGITYTPVINSKKQTVTPPRLFEHSSEHTYFQLMCWMIKR